MNEIVISSALKAC